jgi:hypothetical protein
MDLYTLRVQNELHGLLQNEGHFYIEFKSESTECVYYSPDQNMVRFNMVQVGPQNSKSTLVRLHGDAYLFHCIRRAFSDQTYHFSANNIGPDDIKEVDHGVLVDTEGNTLDLDENQRLQEIEQNVDTLIQISSSDFMDVSAQGLQSLYAMLRESKDSLEFTCTYRLPMITKVVKTSIQSSWPSCRRCATAIVILLLDHLHYDTTSQGADLFHEVLDDLKYVSQLCVVSTLDEDYESKVLLFMHLEKKLLLKVLKGNR